MIVFTEQEITKANWQAFKTKTKEEGVDSKYVDGNQFILDIDLGIIIIPEEFK